MNVLFSQTVLWAIFDEAFACIKHEDVSAPICASFVKYQDAGGDTGAVEKVGW
jgi:hypothetical protein